MNDLHKYLLSKHRATIIQEIPTSAISFKLYKLGFITKEQYDALPEGGYADKIRGRRILDIVLSGSDEAFDAFCNACVAVGCDEVVAVLRPQPAYYTWQWIWSKDGHVLAEGHSKWVTADAATKEGSKCKPNVTTCDCGCSGQAVLSVLTWTRNGHILKHTPPLAEIVPASKKPILHQSIKANLEESTLQYIAYLEKEVDRMGSDLKRMHDDETEHRQTCQHTAYQSTHAVLYNV
jgi:hypothetical protein